MSAISNMEIYKNDDDISETSPKNNNRGSDWKPFPHRELNDWVPFWEKLVFLILGYFGFQLIGTLLSIPLSYLSKSNANLANALMTFLSYFLLILAFLAILFFDRRKTYRRLFKGFKDPKTYVYGALGIVAIYLMSFVFDSIYKASVPDIYGNNNNQQSVETIIKSYPALAFFPIVIFAPFCEELTYRVGLVDTIGHKKKNLWLGILLCGLIFGLIHFDWSAILNYYKVLDGGSTETIKTAYDLMINELLNLPIYCLSGIILALVYTMSGNISSSMVTHLLNNLLSFLVFFIPTSSVLFSQGDFFTLFSRIIK